MINIHITEEDIQVLLSRYAIGNNLVKSGEFCEKIDEQFLNYDLAK